MIEQRRINPWAWQNRFGFSQAVQISGANRVLWCAGQTSVDDEGRPVHGGDMAAQVARAFDNLETVLTAAGFTLGDVVRLNYYTTDVDGLLGAYESITTRLSRAGSQPASTLMGVARLAFPELMIEIEATAVGSTT